MVLGNDSTDLVVEITAPDGLASISLNGSVAAITDGKLRGLAELY
ncbi:MAG: hypothetical protein WKF84_29880 [Pyrinomonadaceae bacterium]